MNSNLNSCRMKYITLVTEKANPLIALAVDEKQARRVVQRFNKDGNFRNMCMSLRPLLNIISSACRQLEFAISRRYTVHDVVLMHRVQLMRLLLDLGLDPNVHRDRKKSKNTLLHVAACGGDEEIVRALLDHGADPNILNDYNLLPVAVVRRSESPAIYDLLVELYNKTHAEPWTPCSLVF